MADPALGFRKMSVKEFERGWSGTCLVFTPGQEQAELARGALAVDTLRRLPEAVQEDCCCTCSSPPS